MNNKIKIISVILVILILLFTINTKVFALTEIIEDGKDFLSQADKGSANISVGKLQEVSGYLYNILLAAGVIIAVIVATALGLQFMLAGAEGQAKVKEMILPFVIGCIVVFGGFGFWKIALTIGKNIEGTYTSTSVSAAKDDANSFIKDNDIDTIMEEWQRAWNDAQNNPNDNYKQEYLSILQEYSIKERDKIREQGKNDAKDFCFGRRKEEILDEIERAKKEYNNATISQKEYWNSYAQTLKESYEQVI